jgi:hypothetical protein
MGGTNAWNVTNQQLYIAKRIFRLIFFEENPFQQRTLNLFSLQITLNTGLHKVSKNPSASSKFWAPEVWREAITILGIRKHQGTMCIKCVLFPAICPAAFVDACR